MPLQLPQIGASDYEVILADALARIRVHNPEWTNHNDSDPGVTLLQLFAFMTENLLYRSNLIPDRNRVTFLKLLGIALQPAAAARGLVAFANARGPLETITLDEDVEVRAGEVPFRTEDAVDVLPVQARVYYKRRLALSDPDRAALYRLAFAEDDPGNVVFYETALVEPPADAGSLPCVDLGHEDVIDGSLWIALLAREGDPVSAARSKIANKTLSLGVYPAEEPAAGRVLAPGGEASAEGQPTLVFELPATAGQDGAPAPRYERVQSEAGVDVAVRPGVVKLRLPGEEVLDTWRFDVDDTEAGRGDFPPPLEDPAQAQRLVTWLRVRPAGGLQDATRRGASVKLAWIGINAARVAQRAHVAAESAGMGNGEPDQELSLVHTPVIPGSVRLTINGEAWQEVDDLLSAGPEIRARDRRRAAGSAGRSAKVFVVERESGRVRFGDGLRGARPPAGAPIQASYDHGGGRQGNVNVGEIAKGPALPPGVNVRNWVPTWGGDEAETPQEAERSIPRVLRHRDRLVTREDFEDIVKRTPGVDIERVDVLPLFHRRLDDGETPGAVTVMVVPRYDVAHPHAPVPDRRTLELICEYLEPRRLVSTEVRLEGPDYVPIVVSAGVQVQSGRDFPPVREAVNAALRRFLSPLTGGRDERGWPLEKDVLAQELLAVAARVAGVAYVTGLLLGDPAGAPAADGTVAMAGLRLPRLLKVDTRLGDAEPLDALVAGGPGGTGGAGLPPDGGVPGRIVPVPVAPPNC